jgi:hypothetical protein
VWEDAGGDGDEVVEGQGLVEGEERVEAVLAGWADGEAEVDFGMGADGGGHVWIVSSAEMLFVEIGRINPTLSRSTKDGAHPSWFGRLEKQVLPRCGRMLILVGG